MKRWIGVVALCAAVFMMVGASPRPCCGDTTLIGFTDTDLSIGFELGFGNSLGNYSAVYASWTQTVATSNTSIGAILSSVGGLGGTAWLTTEVGPGTSDHVIATGSFTTPELTASQLRDLNTAPTTPLFAGLSLNPGTYYLILQSNVLPEGTFIAWCGEYLVNVVDTTAPGFTIGPWLSSLCVSPCVNVHACCTGSCAFLQRRWNARPCPVHPALAWLRAFGHSGMEEV